MIQVVVVVVAVVAEILQSRSNVVRHYLTIWITITMMLMIRRKIHHNASNSCRLHNRNQDYDTTTTNTFVQHSYNEFISYTWHLET